MQAKGMRGLILGVGSRDADRHVDQQVALVSVHQLFPSLGISFLICKMKGCSNLRGPFQLLRRLMLIGSSSVGPT